MRRLPAEAITKKHEQPPVQRHESAHKHVTGEAVYVDDQIMPANTLYAYVGLSQIACGKLKRLDLNPVRAAPGVIAVLGFDDLPAHTDIGPIFPGDPLMVGEGGRIEFHGQVLFALAATSQEFARKAARLAIVEYEAEEPDLTIEQGLANQQFVRPSHIQQRSYNPDLSSGQSQSPVSNEENTRTKQTTEKIVEQIIEQADHRLSGELQIGGQEHMYLEGQVSLCIPTEDGGMLVYCSTQHPTEGQKLVAEVLDIPMHLVTFDVRRMGGGFGGKETNANQWACIAALLASKTGRAVKLRLARADDITTTGKRHHFLSQYNVGFNDQGLIEGLDLVLSGGCGHSPDLSDSIVDRAMFHADNAYFLSHVHITGHRVKTNTVSNTAFRGFGGPQGMLAIEDIIDKIARVVNKDTLAVRKLNFYSDKIDKHGQARNTTHYGQTIEQHIIPDLVDRLEISADYQARRSAISDFNRSSPILKKGLALTPVKFGISFTAQHLNQAGALVHVYIDGSIHLNHGGTEMGQGLFTKVAQIVAHEFQVDISSIHSSATRTDKVPNTSPTAASSGTDLNGMAARDAVLKIKHNLTAFAAGHFDVNEDQVNFKDGNIKVAEQTFSFTEFVQLAYMHRVSLSATGYYKTPKIHYDREASQGRPFFYFANGAAVSEVIIDSLTGEYKLLRVDICQDVGHSINPAIDIGQIEGGFIQGMGWLTCEELIWDQNGRLATNNPASYKIPAIGDMPPIFNVELLPDSPNVEATVFHSKAVGEPPLMLAISVWSALSDAIASLADYRFSPALDAPATPERILKAVEKISRLARIPS